MKYLCVCILLVFGLSLNEAFAKSTCFPSEDTQLLIEEGGSVPVGSQGFYYTASRLPKIIKCSEAGELSQFFCIEWEGSVYEDSGKEVKQGAKIIFDLKTGKITDITPSTNEAGFKFMSKGKLVLIEKDLKKNMIELLNSQFLSSKTVLPQMTLAQDLNQPTLETSMSKPILVILSLLKESMGSLHLNCKNYGRLASNFRRLRN